MFFKFQEEMRKIFLEDIDKHNVLAWIIYKTNYQTQYDKLLKYQCYLTTRIISDDTKISTAKVQRILKNLESDGFISYVKKSKSKHESSIIFADFIAKNDTVNDTVNDTIVDTVNYTVQAVENTGVDSHNNTEDNTVNNTVTETINDTSSKNSSNIYIRIIDKLNQKTNKRFNPNAKQNVELIRLKLEEGYLEDDFYKVIENKCNSWSQDSTMQQYLRPATLFGVKFDTYLNECNTKRRGREL